MSVSLDGTDDYVDHGDITGVDLCVALTSMAWVYWDAVNASEGLIGKGGELYLYVTAGSLIGSGQSGTWEKTSVAPTAGTWQHWAVVYDGSLAAANRIAIYLNGVAQALGGTNAGTALSDQGATTVKVGGNLTGLGYVAGRIGHVRQWLTALSVGEIVQEMWSYRPVRTTNLHLCSPYDSTPDDYSGAANHGTVTGALYAAGPPLAYGAPVLIL